MTLQTAPGWALALLERARVARLGLLDERDEPRVLPVDVAVHQKAIWSAIDHKPKRAGEPARVRRLHRRPEADLLVDEFDEDWTRLAWVELRGRVTVVEADQGAAALDALAAGSAPYRERRPAGPLLRLDVERVACWRASDGPLSTG